MFDLAGSHITVRVSELVVRVVKRKNTWARILFHEEILSRWTTFVLLARGYHTCNNSKHYFKIEGLPETNSSLMIKRDDSFTKVHGSKHCFCILIWGKSILVAIWATSWRVAVHFSCVSYFLATSLPPKTAPKLADHVVILDFPYCRISLWKQRSPARGFSTERLKMIPVHICIAYSWKTKLATWLAPTYFNEDRD